MNFASAILAALLALPRHFSDADEPSADRLARLAVVAESIGQACDVATCTQQPPECVPLYHGRVALAGAMISMAFFESTFSRHVHVGECLAHECDKGAAVGLWQIHRRDTWDDATWEGMRGLDGTAPTASVIAVSLAVNIRECGSISGAFGHLAAGHGCQSERWGAREIKARSIAEQIRRAMRQ